MPVLEPGLGRTRKVRHLRGFMGILQVNAYAGYGELYRGVKVIEAACMAHAQRKFWNMHEKTSRR